MGNSKSPSDANNEPTADKQDGAEKADSNQKSLQSVSEYIHKFFNALTEPISSLGKNARLLLTIAGGILAAIILFWLVDKVFFYYLTRSYVDQVASVFDLNEHLANALILVTFIAAIFFGRYIWSFSKKKRIVGIAGISALLIGHSVVLWYGTRSDYFDRSGKSVKCYVLTRDGKVTYGEHPGVDPATGRLCRPITAEMLERLKKYETGKRPQRIADVNPTFFDQRTGEPIVWYYRSKDNEIEIFDLMGFHPDTGDELTPISKDIVEQWKTQLAQIKRHIPKIVDPEKYVFFDPRNGAPRAWYWRDKKGNYEFYDSPGFHPQSGDALLIVTRADVDDWKKTSGSGEKAAQRVDPNKYSFFDPTTGAARAWYWRSENGTYEFFDGPGFHPRNGELLKPFTKQDMQNWQRDIKDEQDRLEKERKKRAEEDDARNRALAIKEEADKNARDAARKQLTQASGLCDDLAANPSDVNRVGEGVPFDDLKARAQEAVSNCEIAVSQSPSQLRFKYQLARALHWTNKKRAFEIFQDLVRQRYPAAFDNLGWLYLTDKKDPNGAIALFRLGVKAGDTDSMLSLAEMIDRGHLVVADPAAEKLALYQRAAQLGNKTAIAAYQTELANIQIAEQNRAQQLQQQQMILQLMGGVLRR